MLNSSSTSNVAATTLPPLGPVHSVPTNADSLASVRPAFDDQPACREDHPKSAEFSPAVLIVAGEATPVLVRWSAPDDSKPNTMVLELFNGHRQIAACIALDLASNLLVVQDVSDLGALRHMSFRILSAQADLSQPSSRNAPLNTEHEVCLRKDPAAAEKELLQEHTVQADSAGVTTPSTVKSILTREQSIEFELAEARHMIAALASLQKRFQDIERLLISYG